MRRINLIPIEAIRLNIKEWITVVLLRSKAFQLFFFIVIICVGLMGWLKFKIKRYNEIMISVELLKQEEQGRFCGKQDEFNLISAERKRYEKEIKVIQRKLVLLKEKQGVTAPWSNYMLSLIQFIPKGLWFNNLSFGKETITIKGISTQPTAVSQFMLNLNKSGIFFHPTLNYIEKTKLFDSSMVEFEIVTLPIIRK
ncbi:MAG: PilN domain-containing protein [bacterium]